MDSKYLNAAMLLLAATAGGILLSCVSKRIRDVFFFLMVILSAVTERLDVNFVSREWYRGTTCGFEVSIVDVLSVSLLAGMVLAPGRGERRWFPPGSFGLMILFFLFSAFCVAIADPRLFGYFALSKLVRGMIMFLAAAFYVRGERKLRLFILALGTIVCYQGLRALQQRYGFHIHRVYGTLDDANSLSMYLCMCAPVLLAAFMSQLPRYLKLLCLGALGLALIGVILTISRTGVITLILVMLGTGLATFTLKLSLKKIGLALVVVLAAAGVLAKSWHTLGSRFQGASMKDEVESKRKQGRGYYFRMAGAIMEDTSFGVGPNNWSYWVSNKYGPKLGFHFAPYPGTDKEPKHTTPIGANLDDPQAAPAHSLAALTVGEMGWGGLFLFLLLWCRWFQMGASFLWKRTVDPMRRLGVGFFFGTCGIFCQSITEWVFHQTPIYYTFHIILGILASLYYLKKNPLPAMARADLAAAHESAPIPAALEVREVIW